MSHHAWIMRARYIHNLAVITYILQEPMSCLVTCFTLAVHVAQLWSQALVA